MKAKGGSDVEQTRRKRRALLHTAVFYYAFFVLGWLNGQRGAAFLDLLLVTGSDVTLGSTLLVLAGIASIIGVLAGVLLLDLTQRPIPVVASALALCCVLNSVITLCDIFPVMGLLTFMLHVAMGAIDVVLNSVVARMWRLGSRSYMQFLHFCFAFGAVLSPLATQPFLAPKDGDVSYALKIKIQNQTLENHSILEGDNASSTENTTPQSFHFSSSLYSADNVLVNTSFVHNSSHSAEMSSFARETRVFYAFLISGMLCLSASLILLILLFFPIPGQEKDITIDSEKVPTDEHTEHCQVDQAERSEEDFKEQAANEVKEPLTVELKERRPEGRVKQPQDDEKQHSRAKRSECLVENRGGEFVREEVLDKAEKTAEPQARGLRLVAFVLICAHCYLATYISCADYLMTFVVRGLDWSKASGARLTSVYWIGLAVGRFSGVGVVRVLTPPQILTGCLVSLLLSFLALLLAAIFHLSWAVWLSAGAVGLFAATLFPTMMTYTDERVVRMTGRLASPVFTTAMAASVVDPILLAQLMASQGHMVFVYVFLVKTALSLLCLRLAHHIVTTKLDTARGHRPGRGAGNTECIDPFLDAHEKRYVDFAASS